MSRGAGGGQLSCIRYPIFGQVFPFQEFVSSHGLPIFQLLAPLTLIHLSTMEEKYFFKNRFKMAPWTARVMAKWPKDQCK